jgi:hypothetical protein
LLVNGHTPPPPLAVCIDIKEKDLSKKQFASC